jgi:hypothetical protein
LGSRGHIRRHRFPSRRRHPWRPPNCGSFPFDDQGGS